MNHFSELSSLSALPGLAVFIVIPFLSFQDDGHGHIAPPAPPPGASLPGPNLQKPTINIPATATRPEDLLKLLGERAKAGNNKSPLPFGGAFQPAGAPGAQGGINPAAGARPFIPPAAAASRPAPGMEPKIMLEKTSIEFGTVDEGKIFDINIPFQNSGPGPLIISQVVVGCGCTNASVEVEGRMYVHGDNILPGSKGNVRVKFNTENLGGVEKKTDFKIYTNDPAIPENLHAPFGCQEVKVHANVIKRFAFDPVGNTIEFGRVSNNEANEASILFKSTKNESFQVVGFECPDPMIEMRAEAVDSNATSWKLIATLAPGAKFGAFSRNVKVLTKPEAPPAMLYVQGQVHGPVEIDLPSLSFYAVPKGRPSVRTLVVRRKNSEKELNITNIRYLDPLDNRWRSGAADVQEYKLEPKNHLKVEVKEIEKGVVYHIQVVVMETMPVGSFNTILAFNTGIPGAHENGGDEMRIPLTGVVK